MLFLSILSLLQILFLPGFLVLTLLRMNKGYIRSLVFSVGLSLLINYLLIFLLTLLHAYHRNVLLLTVIIEILFLFVWFWRHRPKLNFRQDVKNIKSQCVAYINQQSLVSIVIFILSAITILFYLFYLLSHFRPVLASTDPLLGWNEWAIHWFQGLIPRSMSHFPQLLPANWSLTYLFVNTSFIQLFIKMLMTVFPFCFLLLFFDLFIQTQKRSYLLALILSGYLLFAFLNWRVFSGFADLTCMFLAALSLYILFLPVERYSKQQCVKLILLGSAFAAASALTKRAGLLFAVSYPFFAYWFLLWERADFTFKEKLRIFGYSALLIIVLVLSSYGYFSFISPHAHEVHFFEGPPQYIAYFQLSFSKRLLYGFTLIHSAIGWFNLYFLFPIALIVGLIRKPKLILLFLWIVFYFLVWNLFFSYDLRNLTQIIPAIGIIAGIGLHNILNLKKVNAFLVLLLIILLAILGIKSASVENVIIQQQLRQQMQFGYPKLNQPIYSFVRTNKLQGKILTNYSFLKFLPGLRSLTVQLFWDKNKFKRQLDRLKPQIIYISKILFTQTLHNQECLAKKSKVTIAQVNRCNLSNDQDFDRLQVNQALSSYKTISVQKGYRTIKDNHEILMMQYSRTGRK